MSQSGTKDQAGTKGDTDEKKGGGARNKIVLAIVGVLVIVGVVGGAVWYFFFRDDSPEAVNQEGAAQVAETIPGNDASDGEVELTGAWNVISGSSDNIEEGSFAGYRVQEELAGIGAKTAVGRTPDVSGTMEISGTDVTSVEILVDMTTLESDDSRRDGQMQSQALQTNDFPEASFVLTEPIALGSVPEEDQLIDATAVGELTLHGVTNEVEVPLQGELVGNNIAVTGQLEITFSDYDISAPQSFAVVSVEDDGVMELQLFFEKAS